MNPLRQDRGFTLLELIIVMGILAVLMGLGLGFLRSTDTSASAAISAVSGELRRASNIARTRGLPTSVEFVKGEPGRPDRVLAEVLLPVGAWHFEPDDRQFSPALTPELNADYVAGRFGRALRIREDGNQPMFQVGFGSPRFRATEGFALRFDVYLEDLQACTLFRLGQSAVQLTDNLVPTVRMVQADGDGSGPAVTLRADGALPLRRWVQFGLVHDGKELWIYRDDRVIGRTEATGHLFLRESDMLQLSPADDPVPGRMDELEYLVYQRTEGILLPLEVEVLEHTPLRFDRFGNPQQPAGFRWMLHETKTEETFAVKNGGILERIEG